MKTDEERGALGAWVRDQRVARGWSPEQLAERLAPLGVAHSGGYIRGIEAGRQPSNGVRRALAQVFEAAPPEGGDVSGDEGLRELAEEIRSLRADLQNLTEIQAGQTAAIEELTVNAMRAIADALRQSKPPAVFALPLPGATEQAPPAAPPTPGTERRRPDSAGRRAKDGPP